MKSSYQRVEGILYRHYRNKLRKDRLVRREVKLEERKRKLKKDIHECNIDFNTTLRATVYEDDKIPTGSTDSTMEHDIESGIDRLESQYRQTVKDLISTRARIREVEEVIENIDIFLEELTEEEQELLEMKYGEKKVYREIGIRLNAAHPTVMRKHKDIISRLEEIIINVPKSYQERTKIDIKQ